MLLNTPNLLFVQLPYPVTLCLGERKTNMKKNIIPFLAIFLGSICVCLLFTVAFVNAKEVGCDRQSNQTYTCQVRTLFFGRIPTLVFDRRIENVVDITIAETDSDGVAYRAEFVTSNGKQVPLNDTFTDYSPVSQQVNTIGSQFSRHQDHVSYRVEPTWWVLYLVGGLCLMIMLLSPLVFLRK
jgi:hypothetical protein